MRTFTLCFSVRNISRIGFPRLANCWHEKFYNSSSAPCRSFRLFASKTYGVEGGYSRKWIRRPVSTKPEGRNKMSRSKECSKVRDEFLDTTVSASATVNIERTESNGFQKIQYCDIQQKIAEKKDIASLVTVLAFDIETTGLSRKNERIIEIALQDLLGGENSTFQTLVNPECYVPNSHVHGITTHMVNRPEIPRMKDLIPILIRFIESRQKPDGYVLLVAHNARTFDVPFLLEEFNRCSFDIPTNWLFLDTLTLARELTKLEGSKLPSKSISLKALREHYGIPLIGSAHRAMSDVHSLSLILQRLTFDLKIPISGLIERSFKATDSGSKKKKSPS